MKKHLLTLIAVLCCLVAGAQNSAFDVNVFNSKNESVSFKSLIPSGKPVVISFWETTCKPCIQELGAFSDLYDDWQDEFDFEIIAVSTDDARSSAKALPLAQGRGWPFVIALDRNGDLRRALNVQINPTLFILDRSGKVVFSHVGYTPGGEKQVYDILKSLK